jgi:hypothetical protein
MSLTWLALTAEDWVGEPPEGRYSRDRAKPEFWKVAGGCPGRA